jgi:hypothetical protein
VIDLPSLKTKNQTMEENRKNATNKGDKYYRLFAKPVGAGLLAKAEQHST